MLVNVELLFKDSNELYGCRYMWLLVFNYMVVDVDVLFICEVVLEYIRVSVCEFL